MNNIAEIVESEMPFRAKWLLIVLQHLDNTLKKDQDGFLFRNTDDICFDTGFTHKSVKKYRQALIDERLIDFRLERRPIGGRRIKTCQYKVL